MSNLIVLHKINYELRNRVSIIRHQHTNISFIVDLSVSSFFFYRKINISNKKNIDLHDATHKDCLHIFVRIILIFLIILNSK